jgi:integrase
VAKLRLPGELAEVRKMLPRVAGTNGKMTFADAAALYRKEVLENPRLKKSSQEFRLRPEATFKRTWPDLFDLELRRITPKKCAEWQTQFESGKWAYTPNRAKTAVPGNSPTVINSCLSYLRRVLEFGVAAGLLASNPAAKLQRKRPNRKALLLPNKKQFAEIVAEIRKVPRWGQEASELVQGLAYSGMRLGEATALIWQDLDFERGAISVRGTKTASSARSVPMTSAFRVLAENMLKCRTPAPVDRVFRVSEATTSLAAACARVGVKKMTHHDLRHLFATTCIESNVDVATVAGWLGHSDGGALAMRVYGHRRPAHMADAVAKVKF